MVPLNNRISQKRAPEGVRATTRPLSKQASPPPAGKGSLPHLTALDTQINGAGHEGRC
jgi:hypothetical protein